jgi:hypothetical protein
VGFIFSVLGKHREQCSIFGGYWYSTADISMGKTAEPIYSFVYQAAVTLWRWTVNAGLMPHWLTGDQELASISSA